MADSSGTIDRVPSSTDSVHNNTDIAFPWPLIIACFIVTFMIAGCLLYLYLHLLDQDKILFRIDKQLCTVAVHDAKVDRQLASKAHVKIKIEVPIECNSISE